MKQLNKKDFERILTANGYELTRSNGDHNIWQKNGNHIAVPKHRINFMIAKRLIKENGLEVI